MFDLVIRNGTVIDGSGAPRFVADVAVTGRVIVAIGQNLGAGRKEIDATGLMVTPGFVDIHTHYDAQASWDPYFTPSSWHGCTTVVMGNCGVGFAPARPDKHEWLIGLMEGVEDIPGAAMTEGITWEWGSFPEYLDALARKPHVIDFGTQMTHAALRAYVMGDRAERGAATSDELSQMASLVTDGMRAGALGFSTSRTPLHKSIDGNEVPGTFADADELMAMAQAMTTAGHGVFQAAFDHPEVPALFPMLREMARRSGRTVSFTMSQTDASPTTIVEVQRLLEEAAGAGLPIYGQVAGRSIGILMCWRGSAHPFFGYPAWLEAFQTPLEERLEYVKSAAFRDRISTEQPIDLWPFADMVTRTFHKMFIVDNDRIDYEPSAEQSIAAIAARTGRSPQSIALDALNADDGHGMIYFPLFNYTDGNLDVLAALHQHPQVRMGLSDAGAHCGAICDGGMPTFMLTHWTRDRSRGPKLSLEHVVKHQTKETADLYGLHDRGTIAVGMKADLNVINYQQLGFDKPRMAYDLPADGRRLVQRARGYVATICSGHIIVENDAFTGAMPGQLVRGPQPSPGR
jgi:N-acyl-D-amino-acid deacylase